MNKRILEIIILVTIVTLMGCTTIDFTTEDNVKIASCQGELKESDFNDSNFFINNYSNKYFEDLNIWILKDIKNNLKNPETKGALNPHTLNMNLLDEVMLFDGKNITFMQYSKDDIIWKYYNFSFEENEDIFALYKEAVDNYSYIMSEISTCNDIIDRCSNPVITKSREVSYPVTKYRTVNRSMQTYINGKCVTTYYTETEPYTSYEYRTEYYNEENPNYNPSLADKERSKLAKWKDLVKKAEETVFKCQPYTLHFNVQN
jgi:hypothetical protein